MQARQSLADIQFLLNDVLNAPAQWRALGPLADTDGELAAQVLEEAAKFVDGTIAPLQRSGDEEGCRFDAGRVHTPAGFRDAYQAFWQGGWPALACAPEDGGQGLPAVLECVLYEWLAGANHGWTMAPGLLHGAYECIKHHASDELKARYLEKVATGEWLATMCLTEAHAGSDLGLVRTRGVPDATANGQGLGECWRACKNLAKRHRRAPRACRCSWCPRCFRMEHATPWSASASKKRWACTAAPPA